MCIHNGHNMCSKELCLGGPCHKEYEMLFISDNLRKICRETAGNIILTVEREEKERVLHLMVKIFDLPIIVA